jgi:tripartite ATP-independent transporter DctM subunit
MACLFIGDVGFNYYAPPHACANEGSLVKVFAKSKRTGGSCGVDQIHSGVRGGDKLAPTSIGLLSIFLFFITIALGIPIAFGLTLSSVLGLIYIIGWDTTLSAMGSIFTTYMSNYTISVIPAFVLMGTIAYRSEIFADVFDAMEMWFGRLPGGLAIGSVAANAVFAGCTGSVISACTVVGKAAIPKMIKAGYPLTKATGCVAASGTLASLIPPSILICLYGLLVSQSIGKLLVAGVVPGIISAIIYMGYIALTSRDILKSSKNYTWKERLYTLKYLWVVGVILGFVMGSIYTGIATPTEAGAVGAGGMFILSVLTGKMNTSRFMAAVVDAARISGKVLILIVAAAFFGRLLVISNLTEIITKTLLGLDVNRYVIFFFVAVVWFVLGMLIDAAPMLVVSVPVVYPVMISLGFDPIWFGIICIKFCEMALITPPVGMAVFATQSAVPNIPIGVVFRGAVKFLRMDIFTVILLTVFPKLVTWLPNLM